MTKLNLCLLWCDLINNVMINWERLSERVFSIIRGSGHRLTMFDWGGTEVTDPKQARRFFVKDPNFMVTVNEDLKEIQINRNANTRLSDIKDVTQMLKNLNREFMVKVNFRVYGQAIKPKDTAYQAKIAKEKEAEDVLESSMYGRAKTSYQEFGEGTRLIIKHGREVDPEAPGARSRSIQELMVEHGGRRHRLSTRDLGAGRAVANHCAHGGTVKDEVAEYIQEMASQIRSLQKFSAYNRRQQFAEDAQAQEVRELAREHAQTLRKRIREFSERNTYEKALDRFDRGERETVLAESDPELLNHYSETHIDKRVERALPIVTALRERRVAQILEASREPFPIGPEVPCEEDILESDDPIKNLGLRVKRVVNRAVESSALTQHVAMVAEKMIEGEEITQYDREVTRNVLENVVQK